MALTARHLLCDALGVSVPCPAEMIGSMAVVPLPDGVPSRAGGAEGTQGGGNIPRPSLIPPLQDALFERFAIEVPVIPRPSAPKQLLRISAQLYNTKEQYEYLAKAVVELLAG